MHRQHHNHGGNDININIDIDDGTHDDYLDHVAVDHVKFTDDDGAVYVLVRRDDLDNLATVLDYYSDAYDDGTLYPAVRTLIDNAAVAGDPVT